MVRTVLHNFYFRSFSLLTFLARTVCVYLQLKNFRYCKTNGNNFCFHFSYEKQLCLVLVLELYLNTDFVLVLVTMHSTLDMIQYLDRMKLGAQIRLCQKVNSCNVSMLG